MSETVFFTKIRIEKMEGIKIYSAQKGAELNYVNDKNIDIFVSSSCQYLSLGLVSLAEDYVNYQGEKVFLKFIDSRNVRQFNSPGEYVKSNVTTVYIKHSNAQPVDNDHDIIDPDWSVETILAGIQRILQKRHERIVREAQYVNKLYRNNHLTCREKQIIDLITSGVSIKTISGFLNLSTKTVYAHRKNIILKMRCKNTLHLNILLSHQNLGEG